MDKFKNKRDEQVLATGERCFRCEKAITFYTAVVDAPSSSKKAVKGYAPKNIYYYKCEHCGIETEITTNVEASKQYLRGLQKYYDDVRYSKLSAEEKRLHDLSKSL